MNEYMTSDMAYQHYDENFVHQSKLLLCQFWKKAAEEVAKKVYSN